MYQGGPVKCFASFVLFYVIKQNNQAQKKERKCIFGITNRNFQDTI